MLSPNCSWRRHWEIVEGCFERPQVFHGFCPSDNGNCYIQLFVQEGVPADPFIENAAPIAPRSGSAARGLHRARGGHDRAEGREPRVLDRDHGPVGECLEELNLSVWTREAPSSFSS
jgi:hypothetical protein